MRIIFMGTPGFAVPTLDALIAAGHDVVAAYTQPPRRAGRGKAIKPSPVQGRAVALGIEVRHPVTLREAADRVAFAALDADVAVVAAYGLILPPAILAAPRLGCINVHASLLPRWRGAAPIQRAILAGDTETGVTIMRMEAGLDTGPMLARVATSTGAKTGGELTQELAHLGATLLVDTLERPLVPIVQPVDGVTYAAKVDKAETRIDFAQPAEAIERQIRAFAPLPGAWFEVAGERIRILAAIVAPAEAGAAIGRSAPADNGPGLRQGDAGTVLDDALMITCGTGAIVPTLVQRAGRAAMTPGELMRGFAIPAGTRLT